MENSCSMPTPEQRRYMAIHAAVERSLIAKLEKALEDAAREADLAAAAAQLGAPPPPKDYFVAYLHQRLFYLLCKADPDSFEGGRREIAIAIIRNCQNIANRYWGAAIELRLQK